MGISSVQIGQAAGILAFASLVPYFVSIFQGRTKPQRATYGIWTAKNIVEVASYIAVGATTTVWTIAVFGASPLLLFILSLKYGVGGLNKLDIFCIFITIVAILLWVLTNNPATALYTSLLASTMGFLPTIKKAYFRPKTENTSSWVIATAAQLLTIFALTTLSPKIALPPVLGFIFDGIIAVLLVFPRLRFHAAKH